MMENKSPFLEYCGALWILFGFMKLRPRQVIFSSLLPDSLLDPTLSHLAVDEEEEHIHVNIYRRFYILYISPRISF